jgi:4-hydroxy-4-methyl-2-oxoglutarate aldolase
MISSSVFLKQTVRQALLTRAAQRLRFFSTSTDYAVQVSDMLKDLQELDTSSLCDADKTALAEDGGDHIGLRLMDGSTIRPRNHVYSSGITMAGVARTVQLETKDDFLAVLRGLDEANAKEVLIVNTRGSSRAVAGELFCAEAERKGLSGIVVDGPTRDTVHLQNYSVRFYSSSVSPYSGTIQSVGIMQETVMCGGVQVRPGDIVVGDSDGIVVGNLDSFLRVLPTAKTIHQVEEKLRQGILSGKSLTSMTNFQDHMNSRLYGKASSLEFRV